MNTATNSTQRGEWAAANAVTLIPLGTLAAIHATSVSQYRDLVQEDGLVEWATVAALVIATFFFARQAAIHWSTHRVFPWFELGLAAFCVFFAGEEISWGQRAIAYQPPAYFLEHNTQQELNIHNLFKEYLRTKYILMGLLLGWGVILPVLHATVARATRVIDRLGIRSPGTFLVPSMAATLALIVAYPWPYTGEVAECMFALGLLIASIGGALPEGRKRPVTMLVAGMASLLLGAGIPAAMDLMLNEDQVRGDGAREETLLLAEDWKSQLTATGKLPSGCGTHMRVFTWVRKHELKEFVAGSFASGTNAALGSSDHVRREFFLDPWNNAYWIWHSCGKSSQRVMLYSFGPNGRRDSRRTAIIEDDIGAELVR